MNERQKAYAVVTLKDLQQDERTEIKSIGNRIQDPTKLAFADRAQALIKQITEATREAAKGGVKEAYGVAGVGILTGHLIKALERIERLEGDIKVLTELLANVESSR